MKTILIVLLGVLSFTNLYALDTKYIPEQSSLVASINIKQIAKKLDKQNRESLFNSTHFLAETEAATILALVAGDYGVSKNDNIYISMIEIDSSNTLEYEDDGSYHLHFSHGRNNSEMENLIAIIFSLQDSSKFEKFILTSNPNIMMRVHDNYKIMTTSDANVVISFNDKVGIVLYTDEDSVMRGFDYDYIVRDLFDNTQKSDNRYSNLQKSKDDIFIFSDGSILSDYFSMGEHQYFELSLNFNNKNIVLDYNFYDNEADFIQIKSAKPFDKALYQYINDQGNFGFISLSINIAKVYNEIWKSLDSSLHEEYLSQFEIALQEIGTSIGDIEQAFSGNIFFSVWEQIIDRSMFEGVDEEYIDTCIFQFAMASSNIDAILSLEIADDEVYENVMNAFVSNGILKTDSILGNSVYKRYLFDEEYASAEYRYIEQLANANSVVFYKKDNILYISYYNNIKNIISGKHKPKNNKTISSLADKNMGSIYIDAQNVLKAIGIYNSIYKPSETYDLVRSLRSISMVSRAISTNHLKTTLSIDLNGNKGNSINWLLSIINNL